MFLILRTPNVWYNSGVKPILPLLLLLVCAPLAGLAAETFVLAPSLQPDAEAVTNMPVVVNMERLKTWTASISFEPCETNEVLIALGCDANADGDLAIDEADLLFGCDCGNWYRADLRKGETFAASTNALTIGRSAFSPSWNLAKVIRRGGGEINAVLSLDVENTRFAITIR